MDHFCELRSIFLKSNESWAVTAGLQRFRQDYQPYHGYFSLALCIFGLSTNFLNIIVLTREPMRTSTNTILATIAVCHMGTMGSYLAYITHFYILENGHRCLSALYSKAWIQFLFFHSIFSIFLHSSGLWLAVLLAFVRLNVIRQIQHNHWMLQSKNVLSIIAAVFVAMFLCCIPMFFITEITEKKDPQNLCQDASSSGSSFVYMMEPSMVSLQKNCVLLRVTLWMNGIMFKLIPCIMLACLVGALLQNLNRAQKRSATLLQKRSTASYTVEPQAEELPTRRRSNTFTGFSDQVHQTLRAQRSCLSLRAPLTFLKQTSRTQRQTSATSLVTRGGQGPTTSRRTNKMLSAILIIFLMTELPQAVLATLSGISPSDVYFIIYPNLGDILDLLSLINSSVTFVLYCSMNTLFRETFLKLFFTDVARDIRKLSLIQTPSSFIRRPGNRNASPSSSHCSVTTKIPKIMVHPLHESKEASELHEVFL